MLPDDPSGFKSGCVGEPVSSFDLGARSTSFNPGANGLPPRRSVGTERAGSSARGLRVDFFGNCFPGLITLKLPGRVGRTVDLLPLVLRPRDGCGCEILFDLPGRITAGRFCDEDFGATFRADGKRNLLLFPVCGLRPVFRDEVWLGKDLGRLELPRPLDGCNRCCVLTRLDWFTLRIRCCRELACD